MNSSKIAALLLCKNNYNLKLLAAEDLVSAEEFQLKRERFDLNKYSDGQCEFLFRFTKAELLRLIEAFGLPDKIVTADRCRFDKIEALCILLRRFAYPNRLGDLQQIFHRSITELSRIINWMIKWLHNKYGFLTTSVDLFWLDSQSLSHFAKKISEKGSPLPRCVGFIDRTLRPICRPSSNQKEVYSGHKRVHGLKFQSVVHPNGLIGNLYGPIEGRRHDSYMLLVSNLLPQLQRKYEIDNNKNYYLYGDPAYPVRPQLIGPFRKSYLTPQEQYFNKSMSAVRQCVEWEFGRVLRLFAFLDFKKNLKLHLQPVGKYYHIGVLLANCHACIRGTQTSAYFNVLPPSLEEYLDDRAAQ